MPTPKCLLTNPLMLLRSQMTSYAAFDHFQISLPKEYFLAKSHEVTGLYLRGMVYEITGTELK